jgi:hypothetical protein
VNYQNILYNFFIILDVFPAILGYFIFSETE